MNDNCLTRRIRTVLHLMVALIGALFAAAALAQAVPSGNSPVPAGPQPPLAAQPTGPGAMATTPITLSDGYVIGVGDVLEVSVLGRAEFQLRVQVQVDGTIQLPLLKTVMASNTTVLGLREKIRRALVDGGYYTDPVVSVVVVTYASRYVTVLGEVGSPGLVPIDRAYRVSEILARVGGVKASAADELTLRRASGQSLTLPIAAVAGGGPDADPIVNPGDKIYVAQAGTFYIYGQVAAPGAYRLERAMTLRQALARGGGLTERGTEKRIKLFRNGREIPQTDLNGSIQAGDTIVIGERFF